MLCPDSAVCCLCLHVCYGAPGMLSSGQLQLSSSSALSRQVQRPEVQPVIIQDLFIFRAIAKLANSLSRKRLGTNAELILDEFAAKLLEELDYRQEARNIEVGSMVSCHPQ